MIAKDVSLSGEVIEEEVISRAQNLDFVYSQSGTLYNILPNATRSQLELPKPNPRPHDDGIIGSVENISIGKGMNRLGQISLSSNTPMVSKNPSPVANSLQTVDFYSI